MIKLPENKEIYKKIEREIINFNLLTTPVKQKLRYIHNKDGIPIVAGEVIHIPKSLIRFAKFDDAVKDWEQGLCHDAAYFGYTKEDLDYDIKKYRELIESYKKTPKYFEGEQLINNEENKNENN